MQASNDQQAGMFNGTVVSWLWTLMFIVSVATVVAVYLLKANLDNERLAESREVEYTKLGHALSDASDLLTSEVRMYVMSADPKHLQAYWYEVDTERTREAVLHRLEELGAPATELALLDLAKQNSDNLVSTEIRGMKLILRVTGVSDDAMPVAIREFRLTASDLQLSPGEQVELARMIMFDEAYAVAKKSIMGPIAEFLTTMHNRITVETELSRQETNKILYLTIILIIFDLILLLLVVWHRLFPVKKKGQGDIAVNPDAFA